MADLVVDTVIAEVLVNAITAVGRRLATEAAGIGSRRQEEDLAVARWFDTYRLTSNPPELPDLPQTMSEQLVRFLQSNDVQAVLHELLADRLSDAPEVDVARVHYVFDLALSQDVPDYPADLGRILFDYYDGQISELTGRLSGRLQIRDPELLRQIRSEALAARQVAILGAIKHDTEVLTRRSSADSLQPAAQSPGNTGPGIATAQVLVGDIPLEPAGFQPRTDLSGILDQAGGRESAVHALIGMRGVGKTQLAAAYARARLADRWRLVAWINAGNLGGLLAGLAAVAEALGLTDGGRSEGADDVGQAVRHRLEVDGDRCLVVFDNAADPDVLRLFLPVSGGARVLITSNRQSMENLGVRVSVEAFSPDEALAFLAHRTGQADPQGVSAVARELGYLPLALAQAAAVIAAQRLDFGTYLNRLRALRVDEYLIRDEGQPYPYGVAEAVLMSLDALRAGDLATMCTAVMEIMSVLSTGGTRRALLHDVGQTAALAFGAREAEVSGGIIDSALARLAERSLLAFSLDGRTVIAHRLVMRVIREGLTRQGRILAVCRAVASVLDKRLQTLDLQDRPAVRDIVEQIAALQENTAGSAHEADVELAKRLLRLRLWSLKMLNKLGDSAAQAILLGELLIADCERVLAPDHPDTMAARSDLATAYRAAGRYVEGASLHEQALAAYERVLGPDHPDTLASRNSLGGAYILTGRYAQAIQLIEQALADRERVLGPDHPDTWSSRSDLASAYQGMGRYAEAMPLHEQALAVRERVLGPDHPDTLGAQNNLANAYREMGQYAEAIRLLEQALAGRERVLGPDHPDTLVSQSHLAVVYQAVGRSKEAILLYEKTLAVQERVLGPDHPLTWASRANLAATYLGGGLGKLSRAYNEVTGRGNVATAYPGKGRAAAKAIPLFEQVLAAEERVLGPDHPDTMISRGNLGNAYSLAGRHAEAIPLFEQALAAKERAQGPDHVDTMGARNNLALAYRKVGRLGEAISLLERALAAEERVLGPDHPLTWASRANLAASYMRAGRWVALWRAHLWRRARDARRIAGEAGTRKA
jgi:tetratricopeptide (TPR) repeat protein